MRKKLIFNGEFVYSFGKNGEGLSDEFAKLNEIIDELSKQNHVYLIDAIIDSCDDVYDLKFKVVPRENNEWCFDKNSKVSWFSNFQKQSEE